MQSNVHIYPVSCRLWLNISISLNKFGNVGALAMSFYYRLIMYCIVFQISNHGRFNVM